MEQSFVRTFHGKYTNTKNKLISQVMLQWPCDNSIYNVITQWYILALHAY